MKTIRQYYKYLLSRWACTHRSHYIIIYYTNDPVEDVCARCTLYVTHPIIIVSNTIDYVLRVKLTAFY